jgi:hypothetical protein
MLQARHAMDMAVSICCNSHLAAAWVVLVSHAQLWSHPVMPGAPAYGAGTVQVKVPVAVPVTNSFMNQSQRPCEMPQSPFDQYSLLQVAHTCGHMSQP